MNSNQPQSGMPKYWRLADDLREQIRLGQLAPGERLPSVAETRALYGVSLSTVDKAHGLLEKDGLIVREQGRGTFVGHRKQAQGGNIGLLLCDIPRYDSYTREVIAGIQQQARIHGAKVMLVDEHVPITELNVGGVLLLCESFEVAALNLPSALPRVLLLSPANEGEIANVVADDFGGARLATQHLLEAGHRRISMMLAKDNDAYSMLRLAGYRSALEDFGVPFDDSLCYYINKPPEDWNYILSGEEAMMAWMDRGWRELNSTAVLAPNDIRAFGIMRALNASGLGVPQDVSVVGFDGVAADVETNSPLTTVQVPLREIGAQATQMLWEQIHKGEHSTKQVVLPVKLKTGRSSAPVRETALAAS